MSALTRARNRNTQYTGSLSTLCCFLPFGFLRLTLFGHVITSARFSYAARVQPIKKPSQREPRAFEVSDQGAGIGRWLVGG
jgi:hypothetical protein